MDRDPGDLIQVMPLFKNRKSKSPSNPPSTPSPPSRYHPARSVEQLVHPALVAPPTPINTLNNNSNQRLDEYPDHRPSDYRLNYDSSLTSTDVPPPPPSHQRPPQHQEPTQLHRSQSQRQPHLQQRDRPTVSVVAPEDPQPRRSKRSLFVRPSSGFLERSVSVKGKSISHPISQPTSPQQSPHNTLSPTDEDPYSRHPPSYSDNSSPVSNNPSYEQRTASLAYQQPYQQQQFQRTSRDNLDWPLQQLSQQQPSPHQSQSQLLQQPLPLQHRTFPSPLERSSTDPSFLEQPSSRPSPTDAPPDSPRYTPDHQGHRAQQSQSRIQQDLVFNSRPPSRQTLELLAPCPQTHPDAMQQASSQVPPSQSQPQSQQQPPPTPIANDRAPGDSSRRGSTAQTMPEPGRGTPTGTRTIEDPSEIDVRALLQKHEELRELILMVWRVTKQSC